MNIAEKLPYALQSIRSISTHEDEDSSVRLAALDRIKSYCDDEAAAVRERVAAKIEAQVP